MNYTTWQECDSLNDLLQCRHISKRKARLFCAAACRLIALYSTVEAKIEDIEYMADRLPISVTLIGIHIRSYTFIGQTQYLAGLAMEHSLDQMCNNLLLVCNNVRSCLACVDYIKLGHDGFDRCRHTLAELNIETQDPKLVPILKDIVGNPYLGYSIDDDVMTWHGGTVPKTAEMIYQSGMRSDDLAIFADLIEDAGHDDAIVSTDLRHSRPRYKGYWIIDYFRGPKCR